MKYVAAIDQGTTSTRCILFDQAGQPKAAAQQEHRQIYPRPGWVEHDPTEIWARTLGVFAEALGLVRGEPGDLAAIGVTNQRETTVIWEKSTGQPDLQRPGLAGYAHGRPLCRTGRAGGAGSIPAKDRPAAGHLFLGPENPLAPGPGARRPKAGRKRRIIVRDHRRLAGLEPDRRSRDRCDQCRSDPADEPGDPGLG